MAYRNDSFYPNCYTCPETCFPQDFSELSYKYGKGDRRSLNLKILHLSWLPVGSNCAHQQGVPQPNQPPPQHHPLDHSLNIASTLVIWEGCNLLTQRQDIPWTWQADRWTYRKPVKRGRGELQFWLREEKKDETTASDISKFDIRSACLHLIYAAQATQLAEPWHETFSLSDRDLAAYVGLQRRRDLNQQEKINLLERLVRQVSRLSVAIRWLQQGDIPAFEEAEHPLWELVHLDYHQTPGFTVTIRPGVWARHFLNPQGQQQGQGFYQTTSIERDWIELAFRNWQQHPGMETPQKSPFQRLQTAKITL